MPRGVRYPPPEAGGAESPRQRGRMPHGVRRPPPGGAKTASPRGKRAERIPRAVWYPFPVLRFFISCLHLFAFSLKQKKQNLFSN